MEHVSDGERSFVEFRRKVQEAEVLSAAMEKLLLNLVRPRYFIPVHGEYRQLFRHAALAHQVGSVSGEILLLEDKKEDDGQ